MGYSAESAALKAMPALPGVPDGEERRGRVAGLSLVPVEGVGDAQL